MCVCVRVRVRVRVCVCVCVINLPYPVLSCSVCDSSNIFVFSQPGSLGSKLVPQHLHVYRMINVGVHLEYFQGGQKHNVMREIFAEAAEIVVQSVYATFLGATNFQRGQNAPK